MLIFNDALQLNCVRDSQGITAKFNAPFLQGLKDDLMSSQRFSVRFLVAQQSDYIYSGSPDSQRRASSSIHAPMRKHSAPTLPAMCGVRITLSIP